MVKDTTYTSMYEGGDILKGCPETVVCSFTKLVKKDVLHEFMFPLHWNTVYIQEDFFDYLMHAARNRDSIWSTCGEYGFEREDVPSNSTVLHHLRNLDMETVDELYKKANKKLVEIAQKNGVFRKVNVQLAIDFVGIPYYGRKRDEWRWKKGKKKGWRRVYRWILVSFVDGDQKYVVYAMPVPYTAPIEEVITSALTYVYRLCKVVSGTIYVDREFFSVKAVNALQKFCSTHKSYWLMPAQKNERVKRYLREEGIYRGYTMHNKKREPATFTLAVVRNEKGKLHAFATNLPVVTKDDFSRHYNRRWSKITDENGDLLPFGVVLLDRLYSFYERRWQIETNIRCIKHPFLITTSSPHMPAHDYLMRFAVLCCFAWMVINALLLKEFGSSYWLKGRTFERLLCAENIIPRNVKYSFTKAPKTMDAFPKDPDATNPFFAHTEP